MNKEYAQARKSLLPWTVLLAAWQIIGVSVSSTEGFKIGSAILKIKRIDLLPYTLALMVLYFSYRLTIHWFESSLKDRRCPATRIDFGITTALAALAVHEFLFSVNDTWAIRANILGYIAGMSTSFYSIRYLAHDQTELFPEMPRKLKVSLLITGALWIVFNILWDVFRGFSSWFEYSVIFFLSFGICLVSAACMGGIITLRLNSNVNELGAKSAEIPE